MSVPSVASLVRADITEASGFFKLDKFRTQLLNLCLNLSQVAPRFVPLKDHAHGLCKAHRPLDALSADRREGCSGTPEAYRIVVSLLGHFDSLRPSCPKLVQVQLSRVRALLDSVRQSCQYEWYHNAKKYGNGERKSGAKDYK